jgi:hypothetical protein
MPTFTGTQEERVFDLGLEDGSYDLKIMETTEETGNFGPQLRVRFRVLDHENDEGEPIEFSNWYTYPINKTTGRMDPVRVGTEFGNLFSAALFNGEPYPEGTELDTDDLVGRTVRVLLGTYMTKAQPGYPSKKKFGILRGTMKASKKKKAAPVEAAPKADTLRKRLVDDDDDDDDLADA